MTTDAKREARQCDNLARAMGYTVVNLEQQRASRTYVGLPDRRLQGKAAFFFELKFGRDKLTREQHTFLRNELDAGALASCGGFVELSALLGAIQRTSLVYARNLCGAQLDAWVKRGFRSERRVAA